MLGGSYTSVSPMEEPSFGHKSHSNVKVNPVVVPNPPPGFHNEGNTCYANATLQSLFSTALSRALLDPKTTRIFRRYSSNAHLLLMDSKSLNSMDYDESSSTKDTGEHRDDETATAGQDAAAAASRRTKEVPHWRKRPSKQRQHQMSELCKWTTKELTILCQKHHHAVYARPQQQQQQPHHHHNHNNHGFGFFSDMFSPTHNHNNNNNNTTIDPANITRHVQKLSNCLRWGRQEDAHEFLRALLSALIMDGFNKELSSLFDGLLESAVTCQTCGDSSLTRDRYMDLSLEISSADVHSLPQALEHFTRTELLSNENMVFCDGCETKRRVSKGLRLATAPSILVCHLKRFEYDMYGRARRVNKKISFPTRLDIAPFMSLANKSVPPAYELVAIVVHQGRSCNAGHYLAYVRGGGTKERPWYRISDSHVTRVDVEKVMEMEAYILIYEVEGMRLHGMSSTNHQQPQMEDAHQDVHLEDSTSVTTFESSYVMEGEGRTKPEYEHTSINLPKVGLEDLSIRRNGSSSSSSQRSKASSSKRRTSPMNQSNHAAAGSLPVETVGYGQTTNNTTTTPSHGGSTNTQTNTHNSATSMPSLFSFMQLCGAAEAWDVMCGLDASQQSQSGETRDVAEPSLSSSAMMQEKVRHFDEAVTAAQDPIIGLDVISKSKSKEETTGRGGEEEEEEEEHDVEHKKKPSSLSKSPTGVIRSRSRSHSKRDDSADGESDGYHNKSEAFSAAHSSNTTQDQQQQHHSPENVLHHSSMRRIASSSNLNERGLDAARAYSTRVSSPEDTGDSDSRSSSKHKRGGRARLKKRMATSLTPAVDRRHSGGGRHTHKNPVQEKAKRNDSLPPRPRGRSRG